MHKPLRTVTVAYIVPRPHVSAGGVIVITKTGQLTEQLVFNNADRRQRLLNELDEALKAEGFKFAHTHAQCEDGNDLTQMTRLYVEEHR